MKVSDQRSAGRYEDIVDGIDLEYILQGEQLKENIVLKTKEALQNPLANWLTAVEPSGKLQLLR